MSDFKKENIFQFDTNKRMIFLLFSTIFLVGITRKSIFNYIRQQSY